MFKSHQLLLQVLLLLACGRFWRRDYSAHLHLRAGMPQDKRRLTNDWSAACLSRRGGGWRGVGWRNQAKGGLLLVVVSVVHYAQIHGKDGCGGGGQRRCAHVH